MSLQSDREKLRESSQNARYDFVKIELDLAITFCEIALSASDKPKVDRNVDHANAAHRAALHFVHESELTGKQSQEIKRRVTKLESLFDKLENRAAIPPRKKSSAA